MLQGYQECSGQLVNREKSGFAVSERRSGVLKRKIIHLTGFWFTPFPLKYLGCPLIAGRIRSSYFQSLVDSVSLRINMWSSKWLSFGGRLVLLKSVLNSIPIHLLTVLHPPNGVLWQLRKLFARFL